MHVKSSAGRCENLQELQLPAVAFLDPDLPRRDLGDKAQFPEPDQESRNRNAESIRYCVQLCPARPISPCQLSTDQFRGHKKSGCVVIHRAPLEI